MAAVSMGTLLATIDSSIVNVALPTLVRELNTDFATVQWVVLAYLLTLATLLLSVGRFADMKGKKPIYAMGFVIFTIGSVLCGLAANIYMLIAFRVVQAIGATMILALGMAIITESFPASERGKALGFTGTMVSIGIVIGPTIGGIIIDVFSWNWIFLVNLPVGILGTLMVIRFVPAVKPEGKQRFDFLGAVSLFLALFAFLLALTVGQNIGFTDPRVLVLFGLALILLSTFVIVETRTAQPMIDLRLFRNTLFSINLVTGYLTFVAIAGTIILMPFYLENILGYSTREVGILIAALPISMGIIAPLAGSMSDRFGTRPISVIGLGILLFGYIALSSLTVMTSTLGYVLRFLPIGIGMGVFQSPNNSAIMGEAPRDRLGVVSGILAVNRSLGQTTGIAILGALWASRAIMYAVPLTVESATNAPIPSQVAALQDTFIAMILLISLAFGLAIWALIRDRKIRSSTEKEVTGAALD